MLKEVPIGITGFGRTGIHIARELAIGPTAKLSVISSRYKGTKTDDEAAFQTAQLLHFNPPYGKWLGHEVGFKNNTVLVDGRKITIERASNIDNIEWAGAKVAGVIEATGAYKTREELEKHFNNDGVQWVVLTSPPSNREGQAKIPVVILGANPEVLDTLDFKNDRVVLSAASCTIANPKQIDQTMGMICLLGVSSCPTNS